MTKAEMRKIALSAARSQLRRAGIAPAEVDAESALRALDDVYRVDPAVIASLWYGQATDSQIAQFGREWRKWRQHERDNNRVMDNPERHSNSVGEGGY